MDTLIPTDTKEIEAVLEQSVTHESSFTCEEVDFLNFATEISNLAAGLNIPTKSALFLNLPSVCRWKEVRGTYKDIFTGAKYGDYSHGVIRDYLDQFVQCGLFHEIPTYANGEWESVYSKSSFGIQYGTPVARLFLEFETKTGFSLYHIFGQSHIGTSSGVSSPGASLLTMLAIGNGIRVPHQISGVVGVGVDTIKTMLQRFHNSGLIDWNPGKKLRRYYLNDETAKQTRGRGKVHDALSDACITLSERGIPIDSRSIGAIYYQKPLSKVTPRERNNLYSYVGNLCESGVIVPFDPALNGTIIVTEQGQIFINQLLRPLSNILSDNCFPLKKFDGKKYACMAREAMAKLSGSSQNIRIGKMDENEEVLGRVVEIVGSNGSPITYHEISARLKIPRKTTRLLVRQLVGDGVLAEGIGKRKMKIFTLQGEQ